MIEEEVLKLIKPNEEDKKRLEEIVQQVLDRLKGLDAEVEGSYRKGTWLKGDTDLDIFVFYPKEVGKEYLKEKALNELLTRVRDLNYTIAYAEHPYIIVKIEGVEVDIVPALRLNSGEEAITAADRTPFHTRFITSKLDERRKDEVRLLKRFLKGIGVYGAEIKVKGFSGYVSELLIVYYGSFINVLKEASKWKHPVRVEIVKQKRGFSEPLQIPDPVDPKRNASSAVSLKSLVTFILASRYYLRKPSLDFFFPKDKKYDKIKGDVLILKLKFKNTVVEDILWGQVWRNVEKLRNVITNAGFRLIDINAWGNESEVYIGIQVESKNIGKYYLNIGPMYYQIEHVDKFIQFNENVWVGEDGRLYSIKERKESELEEIARKNLNFKHPFTLEVNWLTNVGDDPWINKFLLKTPPWLK
ncbi:MAG: CCA tRNA nucleotidyltransferase [Sulfolobus sp.]